MEERRYDEMDGGTILNFLRTVYDAEVGKYTDTHDDRKEKK